MDGLVRVFEEDAGALELAACVLADLDDILGEGLQPSTDRHRNTFARRTGRPALAVAAVGRTDSIESLLSLVLGNAQGKSFFADSGGSDVT